MHIIIPICQNSDFLFVLCVQLEKLKEFATSLKATEDHNFQYAGTNVEKIIREKVFHTDQHLHCFNSAIPLVVLSFISASFHVFL